MKKSLLLVLFLFSLTIYAQEYFPTNSGVKSTNSSTVAFTNAKIHITPTQLIKNGTLVIKDRKILNVGSSIIIPVDAQIIDLNGKSIYPSFIDLYTNFGIETPKRGQRTNAPTQYESGRKGYYWNDHIQPETNPISQFKFDKKMAKELLKAGFGIVNTHLQDGIIRGNGLLVSLNPNSSNGNLIMDNRSAQYLSFRKGVQSRQAYPNSLMGAMALLRQVYLDADWYMQGKSKNIDLSLKALNANKNLVQIIDAGGKLNDLRADKIGDPFGIQYVILGGVDEYENIAEIKATNASFILPVNFRKAYDVSNPNHAGQISLSDMRKWNQEPSNLKVLAENGVHFSLTTHKLKSVSEFHKNLQKAIKYGFDKKAALAALTINPAKILGKENEIGTLQKGKYANFLITSGDIFDSKTIIYENWVQGFKNTINDIDIKDLTGDYKLIFNDKSYDLTISGKESKPIVTIKNGDKKLKSKFLYDNNWVNLTIQEGKNNFSRFTGKIHKSGNILDGFVIDSNGNKSKWTATKKKSKKDTSKSKKIESDNIVKLMPVTYPNKPFGFASKPKQETILFKNVTIWTNESEGILKNSDVLVKDGKISKIGKNLRSGSATIVDGTGKHLTAGIVDEHSHIAAMGINEGGHNSSAEVTIEDVINPDDIRIYQSLSGGVTSIQILHGSANPIGGRSAIIKLKWGENVQNLIYKDSPKFIKFALGENVKQSRSSNGVRFPQTRMGVEEVFIDYFQRAKEYDALKKSGKPYRKDIELETLAEILNKERFISCHSYVQSEINMLMKVAEKFDFRINTFTHILEGYKVADKMKQHGVGGSTFSDWWAYKFEVNDAIPYNASIMHNLGILVAINSDNDEMQRRLNQEAAKTVKYGDISEEEAWKFVTLNPAKLLHIDHLVGSIKVGKDADIVLWSDNPLSIYAKAEKTLIEGIVYFDIERDLQLRNEVQKQRNELINMMLKEKINGASVQAPRKKTEIELHCDTVLQY